MLVSFIKTFQGYLVVFTLFKFNSRHQVIGPDIPDIIVAVYQLPVVIPVSEHGIGRTLIIGSGIRIQEPAGRQGPG